MLLDSEDRLSNSQSITTDAVGENVRDLGSNRSIGVGTPMAVLFTVDVAADQTTGDESYSFEVEYASNTAQTAGLKQVGGLLFEAGTPTAPALNADLLVEGYQFAIPIPPSGTELSDRYIGVRYDTGGTTPTVTMSAHLVPLTGIQNAVLYPDNVTIA